MSNQYNCVPPKAYLSNSQPFERQRPWESKRFRGSRVVLFIRLEGGNFLLDRALPYGGLSARGTAQELRARGEQLLEEPHAPVGGKPSYQLPAEHLSGRRQAGGGEFESSGLDKQKKKVEGIQQQVSTPQAPRLARKPE
jgi:hypothetical protein